MKDEEVVRNYWECASIHETSLNGWAVYVDLNDIPWHTLRLPGTLAIDEAEAWSAARAFTDAHKQKVAEVRDEVALLESIVAGTKAFIDLQYVAGHIKQKAAKEFPTLQRILASRQQALGELMRGVKEKA